MSRIRGTVALMAGLVGAAVMAVPAQAGVSTAAPVSLVAAGDLPEPTATPEDVIGYGWSNVTFSTDACGSVVVTNPAGNPVFINVATPGGYFYAGPGGTNGANLNGVVDRAEDAVPIVVDYGPQPGAPQNRVRVAYEAPIEWCVSFPDVAESHLFFEEIEWLAEEGITEGYADGTYLPGNTVNRGSMAAFLSRFGGIDAMGYGPPDVPSFPDVAPSHLFYRNIEWLLMTGTTEGYPDGTYRPRNAVNRGSMAAFMFRLAGDDDYVAPTTPTFPDVPVDHLFYREIEWLAETGITEGYPDGSYLPGNPVNRGSMAAFLFRLDHSFSSYSPF